MRLAGILAVLLSALAAAEPVREFPRGLHAVPIQRGQAILVTDGLPDDVPTALPAGWYFTAEGYDRLNTATYNLQTSVKELEAKHDALMRPCVPLPQLAPIQTGWSSTAMVVVFVLGVAVGAGGVVLLR
jgi:hypothetical protein